MKAEHKVIALSIACGLFLWVANAILDSLVFGEGSFLGSLGPEVPPHELYHRSLALLLVVGFGVAVSRLMGRDKRVEEALQTSERSLYGVFHAIRDGLSILDRDLNVVRVNTWMEEMYHDAAPLVGKKCYAIYQRRQSPCPWCPSLRTLETGGPHSAEVPYPSEENPTGWIELWAFPLKDDDGRVVGVIEYVKDITERKRAENALRDSEERYRALFEQAADSIVLIDAVTGELVEFNDKAHESLGYSRDEFRNLTIADFDVTESAPKIAEHLIRIVETGADTFETKHRRKGGEIRDIVVTSRAVSIGGRHYAHSMWRDVTEHRQLEEQLRQAQKMEAVGTLASGVAHDFNNLLTVIFGSTELAKKRLPKDSPAAQALEMVEHAARQASGVTKALLTFGQKVSADKQPVNLGHVVSEVIRLLRRVLPASIEVIEQVADGQDTWVNADATQLQQVLMNLTVNARDAMPDGGQLRISVQPAAVPTAEDLKSPQEKAAGAASGRPGAMLVVQDTGMGMSPEVYRRIFEPFFTTKSRGQGTGLGMSVVHGIVTDHGGEIHIDSAPGQGTRVTIRLPGCEPDQVDCATASADGCRPGQGELILLVDDDEHVRSIATSVLRVEGYDVVQAADCERAAALLDDHQAALRLILLDLDLPGSGGPFCLEEIRRKRGDIPVIVMTGQVDLDLGDGSTDRELVLNKPFRMADLAALVGRTLARPTHEESTRC